MTRLAIVGGGILGTQLAVSAVDRGHEVIQLERDVEPRGASVRNFGLIWISGRAPGRELALALRSRERWATLARRVPAIAFRASGSLLVLADEHEVDVAAQLCASPDAAERSLEMLTASEARRLAPALVGQLRAAMLCRLDAVVEPRAVLPVLRSLAVASGRYRFLPGRTVLAADADGTVDHTGERHRAEHTFVCTGHDLELLGDAPALRESLVVRRLQMAEIAAPARPLPLPIANGDSLRYYPAFDVPARRELPAQPDVVREHQVQLLVAPRLDGALTVGDTHADDLPGAFGLEEAPQRYLDGILEDLLGAPPQYRRRWEGAYAKRCDGLDVLLRAEVRPGVSVVTGLGGFGMTASAGAAEETLDALDL